MSSICLEGETSSELVDKDLSEYFSSILYGILVKKGKALQGSVKDFIELLKKEKLLQAQIE